MEKIVKLKKLYTQNIFFQLPFKSNVNLLLTPFHPYL